jgi:hypothetical protein
VDQEVDQMGQEMVLLEQLIEVEVEVAQSLHHFQVLM